jgi:2-polyprenyl-6-methoxyphenol hydroxylase-like FAD-dependent oxidoreductase
MRIPTSLDDQIAAAREDRLRVLIAGAGVAGVTLAQLLRRDGLRPVLIERAAPDADKGYMLGLMPLVEPVIRRLGVEEPFRDASVGLHRYRLHGHTGKTLRTYSFDTLLSQFGDYRGIARGDLLHAFTPDGAPVTFGATVRALSQAADSVQVTIQDSEQVATGDFDLVVAADGLHSSTRALILRPDQAVPYDTGWGGWVAWIDDGDPALTDLYDEIWGAGFFVGIYPVKGRVGVFVGGDRSETAVGPSRFVARIRDDLREFDKRTERALAAIAAGGDDYYWRFTDVRSATWSVGRVALLGDAAAGFLPTAGIGAGMAMESAGVLARTLATADRATVTAALREYERAQRPRVEAAQANSRQLAHLVFQRNHALVAIRDLATRFVTLKMALGPIRKLLQDQPAA